MTVPVPPDRIGDVLRRFYAGMSVPDVAPDATTVARGLPPRAPVATVGPAAPHYAQPVGGLLGTLLSAGPVGERMIRDARDHPLASAAELTGVPSLARGARDQDFSEVVRGAMQAAPLMGNVVRGLGTLAAARAAVPAAAEAASGGLTEGQLQNWRGIESFLGGQNAANRAARESRATAAAMHTLPPAATPAYAQRAVDMSIPLASSGDAGMLRNMMETGFAGGKAPTMVELPASGAGRAGSTATAMAAARKLLSPDQLRSAVRDEIARRGGATSPEVEMAATEEVARKLASNGSPFGAVADSVVSKVTRNSLTPNAPSADAEPAAYVIHDRDGVEKSGLLNSRRSARIRLDQLDNAHGAYVHKVVPLYQRTAPSSSLLDFLK